MNRYLVISVDPTNGKTFLDPIAAPSKVGAKRAIEEARPYTIPIEALTIPQLFAITGDLVESTDEEMLQYRQAAFKKTPATAGADRAARKEFRLRLVPRRSRQSSQR
jgi:hypothetical protein